MNLPSDVVEGAKQRVTRTTIRGGNGLGGGATLLYGEPMNHLY